MKVLISTQPYAGHFNPTQPIAIELVKRGHEVVWLTGRKYEAKVTATGARFEEMSPEATVVADQIAPDPGARGVAKWISILRKMAVDRIPAQVKDYQRVIEKFPADILLVEWCSWGAYTLRDLTGLPYVTLGINPLVTADPEIPPWGTGRQPPKSFLGMGWNRLMHQLARWILHSKLDACVNEERKKLGLVPLPRDVGFHNGHFSTYAHMMITTPIMEFPRANLSPSVKFIGPLLPTADEASFARPTWWEEMLAHPREKVIHITQGTVATEADKLTLPTVRALSAREDLLVIVTGKNIDETFTKEAPAPSNVRTAEFVPHVLLLPHVGIMVTNAGYNGVLTALSFGVPLVCAGKLQDKADVSSRVAWSGAGLDLRTETPSEKAVMKAVDEIINQDKYREAAKKVMEDFATHDSAGEAASIMEEVVKSEQSKPKEE